jgi:hypothetical protein
MSYDRLNGGYSLLELLKKLNQPQDDNKIQQLQQQPQQQNDSGGGSGMGTMMNIMDQFTTEAGAGDAATTDTGWMDGLSEWFSGLGGEGGSSSWEGAGSTLGYVLAAIAAQLAFSNNTDTVVEGQPTGNMFTGLDEGSWAPSVATEPWLAWGHDVLDWDPTIGEKFDAAVNNSDWDLALKRFPAAADYWADPIRSWLGYDTWRNIGEDWFGNDSTMSEVLGFISDPIGGILNQFEDWF